MSMLKTYPPKNYTNLRISGTESGSTRKIQTARHRKPIQFHQPVTPRNFQSEKSIRSIKSIKDECLKQKFQTEIYCKLQKHASKKKLRLKLPENKINNFGVETRRKKKVNRGRVRKVKKKIGEYVILRKIGEGSCSPVYLVKHLKRKKMYAMKVFKRDQFKKSGKLQNLQVFRLGLLIRRTS